MNKLDWRWTNENATDAEPDGDGVHHWVLGIPIATSRLLDVDCVQDEAQAHELQLVGRMSNKTKVEIELHWDAADAVAACALKRILADLENDLQIRKDGEAPYGFFHKDKRKDIAEINRRIDAFYVVLKYFGEGK